MDQMHFQTSVDRRVRPLLAFFSFQVVVTDAHDRRSKLESCGLIPVEFSLFSQGHVLQRGIGPGASFCGNLRHLTFGRG